jgi:hypothetical protein
MDSNRNQQAGEDRHNAMATIHATRLWRLPFLNVHVALPLRSSIVMNPVTSGQGCPTDQIDDANT